MVSQPTPLVEKLVKKPGRPVTVHALPSRRGHRLRVIRSTLPSVININKETSEPPAHISSLTIETNTGQPHLKPIGAAARSREGERYESVSFVQ